LIYENFRVKFLRMKNYKLTLNEDINNSIKLNSTDLEECYEEALSILGWSIIENREDDKNQMRFEFEE